VEADKIDAHYHNDVLELHIPKGEEAKGKWTTVELMLSARLGNWRRAVLADKTGVPANGDRSVAVTLANARPGIADADTPDQHARHIPRCPPSHGMVSHNQHGQGEE